MESVKEKLTKRKRLVFGVLIGSLVLSLAGSMLWSLLSLLSASTESTEATRPQEEKQVTLYPDEDWRAVMERRINRLQERLENIENLLKSMKTTREIRKTGVRKEEDQPELPPIKIKLEEPPQPPKPITLEPPQKKEKQTPVIREFSPEKDDKTEKKETSEKKEKDKLYIPLGFAKGILLNGLDAPTLQYGRENPHPVLILLTDRSILANNRKLNLKGCFIHASGWGELSSERAYLELIGISCISRDGKIYEKRVRGTVVDADGKTGLKGRVVSKFGSVLAKQFMAGLLEGIGDILRASSTTIQISPVGTLESIQPEDVTKVAVASGVSSAARRLAEFYVQLAKEYFPVIEVQAGRRVSVLFYGGHELEEVDTYRSDLNDRMHR
ncbi:MAG TPA: conjugal transfer protein TraB [Aigarchaeota archaeon]|nr:conjugal transfer protein TraB [Aigarchaeota archaeon]